MAGQCEAIFNVEDQLCKAETLVALKTVINNLAFQFSDDVLEPFQRMFPDSLIAAKITMSHTKVSYMISHWLGLYCMEKTLCYILNMPDTFYAIHFDETITSQEAA